MKLFFTVVNKTTNSAERLQEYQTWFYSEQQTLKKHYLNNSQVKSL